jgi:hypothetical protein
MGLHLFAEGALMHGTCVCVRERESVCFLFLFYLTTMEGSLVQHFCRRSNQRASISSALSVCGWETMFAV